MNVYKDVFRLALPNILSNISVPLIASVDTGLMGYLSAGHLAAVGSSSMIFNFLYWNFGFLRMGTTGMVAQAYGKDDPYEKSRVFIQATLVAICIAFIIVVCQNFLANVSFNLMNLDSELRPLASDYFFTRIWDAPATLMLYILMAWFFGNQNAFIPLLLTLVINITNIGLSIYFVQKLNLGIKGVALGSVIANYMGVLVGIFFLIWKYRIVKIEWKDVSTNLVRFYRINIDIFIRTLMLSITFAFLYSKAAHFGTIVLAVNVIILQFTNWMSYAIDGFAYASEALVGKYIGKKDDNNAYKVIYASFLCGIILAIVFSLLYAFFPSAIARIFTDQESVIDALEEYHVWLYILPIVGFASYIWDGIFIGMTASKAMRNTMLISFIAFLLSYYISAPFIHYHGLLFALSIYLLSRGIAQSYVFYQKGLNLS